jgi:hypothetical protein
VLIGDLDYLKNITLISCNGIHPDTCDLYKDVLIAFKEGESSTVSALNVLGRENFTTLLNAFPTVSNFAIDLFSTIGFTSIYLIGVDLGFVDVKHHHSKSSGYYHEDGQETHDFAKTANTSLIVPGNFRPTVNTKHEFKVSRQVIEQVTSAKPKGQDFYNCSNGARIKGALPIRPDGLLIVATKQQKTQLIDNLKTRIFSDKKLENYVEKFETLYSQDLLMEELSIFQTLLEQKSPIKDNVEKIVNKQKEMLFESYKNSKSLLFYYLYGTVNYANAVLTKLTYSSVEDAAISKTLIETKEKWFGTISKIQQILSANDQRCFDGSSYNEGKRKYVSLEQTCGDCSILVATDSSEFRESIRHILKLEFFWIKKISFVNPSQVKNISHPPDYMIYHVQDRACITISGKVNTLAIVKPEDEIPEFSRVSTYIKLSEFESEHMMNFPIFLARLTVMASLNAHKCKLILAKYIVSEHIEFGEQTLDFEAYEYTPFDCDSYICLFSSTQHQHGKGVLNNGSRAKIITGHLKMKNLFYCTLAEDNFDKHKIERLNFIRATLPHETEPYELRQK